MTKTYIRFFCGFINAQQEWLNRMAHEGWRLKSTGKLIYTFESCQKDEYRYCIDFTAGKSFSELMRYKEFLEDMGYTVHTKNINLNWSVGKVRVRPYGKGMGKISTNPGTYNKELLIVEKLNDGAPFSLHTTPEDLIAYYTPQRGAYLTLAILFILLGFIQMFNGLLLPAIILLALCAAVCIPAISFHKRICRIKSEAELLE